MSFLTADNIDRPVQRLYKVAIEARTKDGSQLAVVDVLVVAATPGQAKALAKDAVAATGYEVVQSVGIELVLLNTTRVLGVLWPVEDVGPTAQALLPDEYGRLYPE